MQQTVTEAKPQTSTKQLGLQQLVVVLVAGLVLFANLGGPRLWDRDEPRNAGCAREMRDRGDWVVPVFNGELRPHKPVLLYWLIMSAYAVFGVNEFAARFWSAVLGVGAAWATYHIGRRLFCPQVGLWAGIILSTSVMFDVAGRAATPDAALIFFSTMALLAYVWGTVPPDPAQPRRDFPQSWLMVAGMYAMMGLAVLAKGPVGFVMPMAVIGLFLLITRRQPEAGAVQAADLGAVGVQVERPARAELAAAAPARLQLRLAIVLDWRRWAAWLFRIAPRHVLRTLWIMRPFTAVAVIAAVAAPWFVMVGLRTDGAFLRGFFVDHHLVRVAKPMEGHSGPLLFQLLALFPGFFPWSVFAVPVLIELVTRIRRRDPWHPGYVLVGCWAAVYLGVFSLVRTKLPSYVTPCYPALALATGSFLYQWVRGTARVSQLWPRLAWSALGVAGFVFLVAVPLAAAWFLPGAWEVGLLGLIPMAGAAAGLWSASRQRPRAAAMATVLTAIAFATSLFGWALERVDRGQQNDRLLAAIDQCGVRPAVGAFGCLEPTWVFYGGVPITELTLSPERELPRPTHPWRPKSWCNVAAFFRESEDRVIITTAQHWKQLHPILGPDAAVLAECPRFLRSGQLLLIGHTPLQAQRDALRE